MTVSEIKETKRELGYTNAMLAEKSGVPIGTVNKILSGATAAPRYETLQAMANALYRDPRYPRGRNKIEGIILNDETVECLMQQEPITEVRENPRIYGKPKTVADYDALSDDRRMELLDGVFYEMSSPTVRHQDVVGSLYFDLKRQIMERKGKCRAFISPMDVELTAGKYDTVCQPDVLVVCDSNKITEKRIVGAPDFVIEVTSPSTSRRDFIQKAGIYEEAGVREYWIVDILKNQIICYNFEEETSPYMGPLAGELALQIYDGEIKIDLDKIKDL